MARKDKIPLLDERHSTFTGYFDLKEIMSSLQHFMENDRNYDQSIRDMDEKEVDGVQQLYWKVDYQQQYSDYYMLNINLKVKAQGKEVEAEIAGKHRVYVEGTIKVTTQSWIIPDYLNRRDKGPLGEFLSKVYDLVIASDEVEECKELAIVDTEGIISEFKQQVNSKF